MRLVEGTDLRALIAAQGHLEARRAARIVNQVGAALDAAHARGLVHRDVKPPNVLLARGDHVYLSDFGLAKEADSKSDLTRAGSIVARAEYVAPEQIVNERVDARADVYALGCLLFEALTGEAPYAKGQGAPGLAHLQAPVPSVVERRPDLPREFDAVVRRAMAKRPSERYQSAGDLGQAALVATGALRRARAESVVATGDAAPLAAELRRLSAPTRRTRRGRAGVEPGVEPAVDAQGERVPRRSHLLLQGVAAGFLVLLAVGVVAALGALAKLGPDPVAGTPLGVGAAPGALAAGGGALWVADAADGTVSRIDPASRKVTGGAIKVGPVPAALAVGGRRGVGSQLRRRHRVADRPDVTDGCRPADPRRCPAARRRRRPGRRVGRELRRRHRVADRPDVGDGCRPADPRRCPAARRCCGSQRGLGRQRPR